jgi:hypothetical protein
MRLAVQVGRWQPCAAAAQDADAAPPHKTELMKTLDRQRFWSGLLALLAVIVTVVTWIV